MHISKVRRLEPDPVTPDTSVNSGTITDECSLFTMWAQLERQVVATLSLLLENLSDR